MADQCDLLSGFGKACKKNKGGVAEMYLFNALDQPFTSVIDSVASGINPNLTQVYKVELLGDNNTLTETGASARNEGTTNVEQVTVVNVKKQEADKTNQMNLMLWGNTMGVIKDRNGVYHAVGIDDGIDWNIVAQTGGAKAEMNGYIMTGTSTTGELSPKLDESTITDFLALVQPNP